ncbi:hypothetical protein, partial [Spongiibacter marinus]|uniref:hypothetical protein n=1 Tax=Spongiibacter marinus TaxID=354246 RepID=UPI00196195DC
RNKTINNNVLAYCSPHLDMVGVGGSNPLGRTKFKGSPMAGLFHFWLFFGANWALSLSSHRQNLSF